MHKFINKKVEDEECVVLRNPPKLGVSTLCKLMDDCLFYDEIVDEKDMQRFIDKLWPRLCAEFEID